VFSVGIAPRLYNEDPGPVEMRKIGMICFAKPVLREDLYIVHKEEFSVTCYMYEGKRPLRRQRRRWMDNIKMDLREIGWYGGIDLAQDRVQWRALMNTVMNLRVP
jgi:hypothetical protein